MKSYVSFNLIFNQMSSLHLIMSAITVNISVKLSPNEQESETWEFEFTVTLHFAKPNFSYIFVLNFKESPHGVTELPCSQKQDRWTKKMSLPVATLLPQLYTKRRGQKHPVTKGGYKIAPCICYLWNSEMFCYWILLSGCPNKSVKSLHLIQNSDCQYCQGL